eukprot:CAMPEP_0170611028 /NCGR_PEP_ID=MMETSP0224-20130122/22971_1 /TAXON_ID=285029 /ORGANISM="Togula jolla, Strain CCCM 725" /LENGTH=390 /DNA_ID=CAMNT_0010936437 /DNA_START=1 /DNA_END=1169 /DNA_ORIENTATION=-
MGAMRPLLALAVLLLCPWAATGANAPSSDADGEEGENPATCDSTSSAGARCAAPAVLGETELPTPSEGNATKERSLPLSYSAPRLAMVFGMIGIAVMWVIVILKFAVDGSLPARLALWGLMPEVCAMVSVRSLVALLRLKRTPTPALVIRSCVTDAGAMQLAEAIRMYAKGAELEVLELPHNPALGAAGLKELVAAAVEVGLSELDFSFNPQLSDDAVDVLSPALEVKDSKLQLLRLSACNLTAKGVARLAESCTRCSLRTLDLSRNPLTGAGDALATACEASVLEELSIGFCGLNVEDVRAVAEQLPYTSIRSLQLDGNGFGSEGLLAIAEHLPLSQVDELGLEGNGIEASCLGALGEAWAKRPFSRLRLGRNNMSQEELAAFIRTLKT